MFGSLLLLFFPAFSSGFYITYLLCGFSDMVDGTIARKTDSAGEFGSRLDTAADLVFVVAALVKLLPAIHMPQWLWIWGGVIAVIKIGTIAGGFVLKKQFVAPHTRMNKIAGLLLFLLPLALPFTGWKHIAAAVCSMATLAAIQEGFYVVTNRKPM